MSTKKDHLIITANSANSMAVGLNFFLITYCKTSVSWYADNRIEVPAEFPKLSGTVKNESRVNNRFFLNYCTFGYTMPWWKWKDWERFIDWMALNGVNLPLAITGQEKIWLNVWKKFGFSEEEIRSYFTGPAYLPWHRMANIDHWEGPLPVSWIDGQAELQQKILKRERELNMKPVLPAFAGHIPKILKDKFPNAKITSLGEWGDFDRKYESYFLDSFDPLFEKIQEEFLKEQTKLFGTDHIYGTDPFNEVTPPSWEPQDLANVSKHIYTSMAKVDEKAQWLQMGWIFYFQKDKWTTERIKAFLQAVPQDKMILLDYYCDHTEIWKTTDSFFWSALYLVLSRKLWRKYLY
ncbi:alpha-N-acetylglucosaminidase TIM-barrel domain-containing protein [Chryseobacterium sp. POE27]|uniref:alpha-N-acetylglucosaminidase TIM-barrel domain-containing protein n=1 Tax=Chryseobacterium sp. POE27 TaxID=3138177 RepID=UPI00321B29CC